MIKDQIYVGIDPGASGSLCALNKTKNLAIFKDTTDKPQEILEWFAKLNTQYDLRMIGVEQVHSLPKVSAKSNFSFGRNFERVLLLAELSGVGVDLVTPKVWQKFIHVKEKGPAIKKEVANIALRLYPSAPIYGPKGGLLDGRSDSLMIAHYFAYNRC